MSYLENDTYGMYKRYKDNDGPGPEVFERRRNALPEGPGLIA